MKVGVVEVSEGCVALHRCVCDLFLRSVRLTADPQARANPALSTAQCRNPPPNRIEGVTSGFSKNLSSPGASVTRVLL